MGQIVTVFNASTCFLTVVLLARTVAVRLFRGSHGFWFPVEIRASCRSTFCSDWQQGWPVAVGGGQI